MSEARPVRKPRQNRGIDSRLRIVDAAYQVFEEKGYYKASTEDVAKAAGVSIGCLYSYFKDRDALFFEILNQRHHAFIEMFSSDLESGSSNEDISKWLKKQITSLSDYQKSSRHIYADTRSLAFSSQEVSSILVEQRELRLHIAQEFLNAHRQKLKIEDAEAAAVLIYNMITAVTEQIALRQNRISEERLVQVCVDALMAYLFE